MTLQWEPPADFEENADLVAWLTSQAQAPVAGGMSLQGYELHTHPDLYEGPFDRLIDQPVRRVAAFGVPALAHPNGVIFMFAYGTSYFYFRGLPAQGAGRPSCSTLSATPSRP
jgi:hypothetical protein